MRSTSSAERVGATSASSSSEPGSPSSLVRDAAVLAEDDDRRVLLRLDLDLGREPRAKQRRADRLAETRLGQEQEVVIGAAHDDERRDQPSLGREQHGAARRLGHVVREHALEEVLRVGPRDPNVVARPGRDSARHCRHGH